MNGVPERLCLVLSIGITSDPDGRVSKVALEAEMPEIGAGVAPVIQSSSNRPAVRHLPE